MKGTSSSSIVIFGCQPAACVLVVKKLVSHLPVLSISFHFLLHSTTILVALWIVCLMLVRFLPCDQTATSSAYMLMWMSSTFSQSKLRSLAYSRNKSGKITVPCGKPSLKIFVRLFSPLNVTQFSLLFSHPLVHLIMLWGMFIFAIL